MRYRIWLWIPRAICVWGWSWLSFSTAEGMRSGSTLICQGGWSDLSTSMHLAAEIERHPHVLLAVTEWGNLELKEGAQVPTCQMGGFGTYVEQLVRAAPPVLTEHHARMTLVAPLMPGMVPSGLRQGIEVPVTLNGATLPLLTWEAQTESGIPLIFVDLRKATSLFPSGFGPGPFDLATCSEQHAALPFEDFQSLLNQAVMHIGRAKGCQIIHGHDHHTSLTGLYADYPCVITSSVHNFLYWQRYTTGYLPMKSSACLSVFDPICAYDIDLRRQLRWFSDVVPNLQGHSYWSFGSSTMASPNILSLQEYEYGIAGLPVSVPYAQELLASKLFLTRLAEAMSKGKSLPVESHSNPRFLEFNLLGVPNGFVSVERAPTDEAKAQAKACLQQRYGLKETPRSPLLLFIGRITQQKNIDAIIDAAPSWIESGGQIIVAGPALEVDAYAQERMKELKAVAARYPDALVVLPRFVQYEERDDLLMGSDGLLFPSFYEPFGYVDLEAAEFATIPIGRQSGGIGKVEGGIYYSALPIQSREIERDSLVEALEQFHQICRHPEQLADRRARVRVVRFPWADTINRYFQIYQALADWRVLCALDRERPEGLSRWWKRLSDTRRSVLVECMQVMPPADIPPAIARLQPHQWPREVSKFGTRLTDKGVHFEALLPPAEKVSVVIDPLGTSPKRISAKEQTAGVWSVDTGPLPAEAPFLWEFTQDDRRSFLVEDLSVLHIDRQGNEWVSRLPDRITWKTASLSALHPSALRIAQLPPFQRGEVSPVAQAAPWLKRAKTEGFNAVELCPAHQRDAESDWGYRPHGPMALDTAMGDIDQLRALVDEAHREKLAVILDMVLFHGVTRSRNQSPGPHIREIESPWGSYIWDLEQPWVQDWLVDCCAFYVLTTGCDGLRLDSIETAIAPPGLSREALLRRDRVGRELLCRLSQRLRALRPDLILIAEDSLMDPSMTRGVAAAGQGLTYAWNFIAMAGSRTTKPAPWQAMLTPELLRGSYRLVNYLDSHDQLFYPHSQEAGRLPLNMIGGNREQADQRARLLKMWALLALPGAFMDPLGVIDGDLTGWGRGDSAVKLAHMEEWQQACELQDRDVAFQSSGGRSAWRPIVQDGEVLASLRFGRRPEEDRLVVANASPFLKRISLQACSCTGSWSTRWEAGARLFADVVELDPYGIFVGQPLQEEHGAAGLLKSCPIAE
ncbi:MAG: glycosyltransferase [Chlamydiia bacterium]